MQNAPWTSVSAPNKEGSISLLYVQVLKWYYENTIKMILTLVGRNIADIHDFMNSLTINALCAIADMFVNK